MTDAEAIHRFRMSVLEHASKTGNVAETCRTFNVSRKTFYKWRSRAGAYGLDALMPKARRAPAMPTATPTHVVERLLTLAVTEPTIGARRYADRLADAGFAISKTTVQKLLNAHRLGRRHQRLARAAAITAMTSGVVTDAARSDDRRGGFCHFAAFAGDLVALDGFYIGNLKGVGRVYQLTAVDVATRWAIMWIILGPPTAVDASAFVDQVVRRMHKLGVGVRAVVTDNGPEWIAHGFRAHLAAKGIDHHRIPPRSPNHNAVVERFHGIALQECWRPAFHRRRFTSIRQLQREADAWLTTYHTRRRNHGDYMRSRTPAQMLDIHRYNQAA
ncbi:MAG: DDE-type integrase/transposase/recombinase [Actinobacteria bacterium]|nr:DDE-type integrase/transposase/recombinase [Actinomycetota bacterium]